MGKKVNVVLPSGRVVSIDEDIANEAQLSQNTGGAEAAQAEGQLNEERSSGLGEGLKAAGEGLADTLSLGAYGKLRGALDPDYARNAAIRGQERSGSRFLGEAAGLALPGLGEAGLLGDAAQAGSKLTGLGLARGAAEAVGGGAAGRAVEGGVLGLGGYVANSNVSGDPLTIEGAVENAGLGAILNVGVGAAVDKLASKAWAAKLSNAKQAAFEEDLGIAQAGKGALEDPPPSWEDFRQAHAAASKASAQLNREVAKEAEDYSNFYSGADLGSAAKQTQKVVNYLQNERYAAQTAGDNIQYIEGKPRAVQYVTDEGGVNERRVISNSKPPASEEYAARMKDYQARMSRVYKLQAGGWDLDETGKWVKSTSTPPDPKRALEELRAIQTDLKAEFPKASADLGKWGDLPESPRSPVPTTDVRVPKSPAEFARMRPDTVAELANSLDPSAAQSFAKYAGDLGLEVSDNAAENVAGVHARLGSYVKAMDNVEAFAKEEASAEAGTSLVTKALKTAIRGGGMLLGGEAGLGFVGRMMGGRLAGEVADSMIGNSFLEAHQSITDRVRNLIVKWGDPTSAVLDKLRPITSYLATSFPSGEHDPEPDMLKQAANRVQDLHSVGVNVNDLSFIALQGLMGQPNDVAFKMHQQVVNSVQHLLATAPKDPGLNTTMFGSNWTPGHNQALELAYRLEAVTNPTSAIARVLGGESHPAATQTLWTVYPAIMAELSNEVATNADRLRHMTLDQQRAYSSLFGQPMTGLQHPVVVSTIQGLFLPKPQAQPSGGGRSTGNPVGRPAAVQSPVAGSNVSSLISQ